VAPVSPASPLTRISAVVITRNEEEMLPAALQSVAFCDETVVVDSGSTDRTRAVAEAHGARVIVNEPWPGFAAQRNFAMDAARHDWVLALDADERVAPVLRDEILAVRGRGFDCAGYRIPRVAFYLGRWVRGTDWYPDPQIRLFDRTKARWEGAHVHESVRVRGPVGRLRADLEHHPYVNISDHMQKIDRYTTLWATQAYESGRRTGIVETAANGLWTFLRNYFVKRGFLLGSAGFTISVLNSYYTYTKLAKLLERQREGPGRR
jgi:glycosyltransferase involved in cell wall biosynthesis